MGPANPEPAEPMKTLEYQQRHEDFARNILLGMKPADAAAAAGWIPSAIRKGVHNTLLARRDIANRIAHLRALQARRLNYSVDSIVAELEALQSDAMLTGKFALARQLILDKAKMLGLYTEEKPAEQGVAALIAVALASPTKQIELSVDEFVSKWGGGHMALATELNGHKNGHDPDA